MMMQSLTNHTILIKANPSIEKGTKSNKNLNKLTHNLQRIIISYLNFPEQLNAASTSKNFALIVNKAIEKYNWCDHSLFEMVPQFYKLKYQNIERKRKLELMHSIISDITSSFSLFDILTEKTKYIVHHQASPGILYESLTSQSATQYIHLRSIEILDPYADPFLKGISWESNSNPNDNLLKVISETCPKLQKLVFKFFDSDIIKIESLSEIINNCPYLNAIECYINSLDQLTRLSNVFPLIGDKCFPLTLLNIDIEMLEPNETYKSHLSFIIKHSPMLKSIEIVEYDL